MPLAPHQKNYGIPARNSARAIAFTSRRFASVRHLLSPSAPLRLAPLPPPLAPTPNLPAHPLRPSVAVHQYIPKAFITSCANPTPAKNLASAPLYPIATARLATARGLQAHLSPINPFPLSPSPSRDTHSAVTTARCLHHLTPHPAGRGLPTTRFPVVLFYDATPRYATPRSLGSIDTIVECYQ